MDRSSTMVVVESGDCAVRSPTRWGEVGDEVLVRPRQGRIAPPCGVRAIHNRDIRKRCPPIRVSTASVVFRCL